MIPTLELQWIYPKMYKEKKTKSLEIKIFENERNTLFQEYKYCGCILSQSRWIYWFYFQAVVHEILSFGLDFFKVPGFY